MLQAGPFVLVAYYGVKLKIASKIVIRLRASSLATHHVEPSKTRLPWSNVPYRDLMLSYVSTPFMTRL